MKNHWTISLRLIYYQTAHLSSYTSKVSWIFRIHKVPDSIYDQGTAHSH
jgi:hypothetical protein